MNTKNILSVFLFSLIAIGFLGIVGAQPVLTANQYSTGVNAIIIGANRLVTLQNSQGSWAWIVTNVNEPTSENDLNIAGVTAEGLLNAYNLTGNTSYLTFAENTGNYLISQYGSGGSSATIMIYGGKNINSYNVQFLYDLGTASGNTSYTIEANLLMNQIITKYPTGQSLLSADEVYRGVGNGNGIIPWDLYSYIQDSKILGNTIWASDLQNSINCNSNLSLANTSDFTYIVGLSGLVIAGNSSAKASLISAQNISDGSWNDADGQVQDTAYAVMALMNVGDTMDATMGSEWLVNNQSYTGITGGWKDTSIGGGNVEISEVDSEAIQAIFSVINQASIFSIIPINYNSGTNKIINAANRLDELQNNSLGSWDWVVTNNVAFVGDTTYNCGSNGCLYVAGVNAEGLLAAYNLTRNSSYLTAAEDAGNYLVGKYGSSTINNGITLFGNAETNINAFNIKSLYDLGVASGNSSYTSEANLLMDNVTSTYPTASNLITADETNYRSGQENGIVIWDLYHYVEDAKFAGNSSYASDLVAALQTILLTNTDSSYVEGLSALVIATGNTSAISALIANQSADGFWIDANGQVQDTAYATMAMASAGYSEQAIDGSSWLIKNHQSTNGGWIENDGNEYSELDSEVIQAIYPVINQPTILFSNDSNNISVIIPGNTTISSSDLSWNGILEMPSVVTDSGILSNISSLLPNFGSGYSSPSLSKDIEVGSSGINLTFNQPVEIIIPGEGGKSLDVGYVYGGTNFVQMAACSSDSLSSGSECYYDDGQNITIWTTHFTQFVTYIPSSQLIIPGGGIASGGNGGGSSGSSGGIITTTPIVPSNNTLQNLSAVPTNSSNSSAPANVTTTTPKTGLAGITAGVIGALGSPLGITFIALIAVGAGTVLFVSVRRRISKKKK